MNLRTGTLLLSTPLLLMLGACESGHAAGSRVKSHLPPRLVRQASVTVEQARSIALAKVPGATLRSEELEREHGSLIYSFDLVVPGKPGVDEVNVDANDASKVEVHHEGPAQEKAESDAEGSGD